MDRGAWRATVRGVEKKVDMSATKTTTTTMVLRNQQISYFFFISSHDKGMKAVHNIWNCCHTPSCGGGEEKWTQGTLKIIV